MLLHGLHLMLVPTVRHHATVLECSHCPAAACCTAVQLLHPARVGHSRKRQRGTGTEAEQRQGHEHRARMDRLAQDSNSSGCGLLGPGHAAAGPAWCRLHVCLQCGCTHPPRECLPVQEAQKDSILSAAAAVVHVNPAPLARVSTKRVCTLPPQFFWLGCSAWPHTADAASLISNPYKGANSWGRPECVMYMIPGLRIAAVEGC
jgi:hypothetical protein